MDGLPRIEEAFLKISRSVDAITAHLNDIEIQALQEALITGLLANKRRRVSRETSKLNGASYPTKRKA
jgi:hypothetical protein